MELKTSQDIKIMREGGRILASAARGAVKLAKEGVTLAELDKLVEETIVTAGAKPAFLGYRPPWSDKSYPSSICASLNDVVVHGLPTERKLKSGDVLKIDFGVFYKGFYTDSALTIVIGRSSDKIDKLIKATKKALELAIKECRYGKTLGDIGFVIGKEARRNGFLPINGLTGHGIGRNLHEKPDVLNDGQRGKGLKLEEGMVLAIEPMFSAGKPEIKELPDGGFATKDGSLTAHFEHTVAITKQGPVVLTN